MGRASTFRRIRPERQIHFEGQRVVVDSSFGRDAPELRNKRVDVTIRPKEVRLWYWWRGWSFVLLFPVSFYLHNARATFVDGSLSYTPTGPVRMLRPSWWRRVLWYLIGAPLWWLQVAAQHRGQWLRFLGIRSHRV